MDFLRNGGQSADIRQTIVTLPSVFSAVCIVQNCFLADTSGSLLIV